MKITSGIFLFDTNGYLLICHPTNHHKYFWSITKGGVENMETYWDAAKRELKEESNISLDGLSYELVDNIPITYKTKKKILHSFFVMMNEPVRDIIYCPSQVVIDGKETFPEMDDFLWTKPLDGYKYLHEAQKRAYSWARIHSNSERLRNLLNS